MSEHGKEKKELSEMSEQELISYRDLLVKSAGDSDITESTQDFLLQEIVSIDNELAQRN